MDAALSKLAKKDVPYAKMIPVQKDSDKSEFVEAQDERWVTPRKWPRCSRGGPTPTGLRLRLASPAGLRTRPRRRDFPLFVRRYKPRTLIGNPPLVCEKFIIWRIRSCSVGRA